MLIKPLLALASAAVLLLLAACGGAEDADAPPTTKASTAASELRARALGVVGQRAEAVPAASAAAVDLVTDVQDIEIAAERLLDFGESQFSDLFPSHQITRFAAGFLYRYYPQTGIYLGVLAAADGVHRLEGVYVMGGRFGNGPAYVGQLHDIIDSDLDGVVDSADAVPGDRLCSAAADAVSGACIVRTLASAQVQVVGSTLSRLFFSTAGAKPMLYAYDLSTRRFIGRAAITGYTPTAYAYVPDHARLYVGDSTGLIHSYSEDLVEGASLAKVASSVGGLAAAGKFLVAQDDSGAWETHYVIDSRGKVMTSRDWNTYSSHYEWSTAQSRLYFFRDGTSPNDLMFEQIDQTTGLILASGESPYHGDYEIRGPIRANRSGSMVLLGSGDIYAAPALTWAGKIPAASIRQALWLLNDEVLIASADGDRSQLRRYGTDRIVREQLQIDGEVLALVGQGGGALMVSRLSTHIDIREYIPSNDSDGDGVDNLKDKFPLDKTAAVDSDSDGYPDAFLKNYSTADSPTGLTLDAYPLDASCHAKEQGDGVRCDPALSAAPGVPDQLLNDGRGTALFFYRQASRIYRWSTTTGTYLSPLAIGQQGADGSLMAPTAIAYSADHRRLYLGYSTGQITWMDITLRSPVETPFAAVAMSVRGLAAAGKYLVAQDDSGAWATHYVFDKAGAKTFSKDWNYYSRSYDWSSSQSRLYFFRDDTSPNDLMYEQIDQSTGKITAQGESPYHGDFSVAGPLRISPSGTQIALGTGDVYSTTDLKVTLSLKTRLVDMQWLADGRLATIQTNAANTWLTVRAAGSLAITTEQNVAGEPVALIVTSGGVAVVTRLSGKLQITSISL